jgi:predicted transcriptional regulator
VAVLGELEGAVMGILWSRPEWLSVREVHEVLAAERELAYTTVMTVLDRLAKKGLATRMLDGRAWLYHPARPRTEEVAAAMIAELSKLDPASRAEVLAALRDEFGGF